MSAAKQIEASQQNNNLSDGSGPSSSNRTNPEVPPPYSSLGEKQPSSEAPVTVPPTAVYPPAPMPSYSAQQQTVVMGAAPAPTVIVAQLPVRPNSWLALAIFTCICCNPLCGIAAIIFSILSASAMDDGNEDQARKYGRVSMWISIAGMLSAVLISIVALIIYFVVVGSLYSRIRSYNYSYNR